MSLGAQMVNNHNSLIEEMGKITKQRNEIQLLIDREEEEQRQIEENMKSLGARLEILTASLAKKVATRNEYDKTILETQSAFDKIQESSQTLLHVLKKDGAQLQKKKLANVDAESK